MQIARPENMYTHNTRSSIRAGKIAQDHRVHMPCIPLQCKASSHQGRRIMKTTMNLLETLRCAR